MWHAWAEPNEENRTNLLTPLTMLALVSFTSPMEIRYFGLNAVLLKIKSQQTIGG
jgi:hypothetical protein